MNVYDSDQIARLLGQIGFSAAPSMDAAGLIVLNTCAIREKAEQKVFSFLGRLAALKKQDPGLIVAVGGCVAQQEGRKMLRRVPYLDLVFGTHAIGRLPAHIRKIRDKRCRIVDVEMSDAPAPFVPGTKTDPPQTSGFVTIMQGCDNYCTYCVVPYVRGPEVSRHPDRIVEEVRLLIAHGGAEVTLLGQNVNSYGIKQGLCSFSQLLERIDRLEGLKRIRFTTSHPKDLSDDLIACFSRLSRLAHHIHLPVQSGADSVLHRMNRRYTRSGYLEKIDKLRNACPDIAITSDFIAGFPGETDADFQQTLSLLDTVRFDGVFAFKYSDRPNAPARRFGHKIPETVKAERLAALLSLQERITLEKHRQMVGSIQEVLVEGRSKKQDDPSDPRGDASAQWTGRTSRNTIVNFDFPPQGPAGAQIVPGMLLPVRVEKAFAHSLRGKPLAQCRKISGMKGDECHAA
jgi:tRNA-2-methylthio-N6-dimethylallyladenosine synthase